MKKKVVIGYLIYLLLGSVFIFALPKRVSNEFIKEIESKEFYSNTLSKDKVIVLDNPLESGLARLYLIENAKEEINVSYFSIESGETPNVFLGALFDAADRGVKVNILLDGMFHGLRGSKRSVIYGIDNHPNMHLKFYEKFNPLMPWTINNRMHDKYILVDNEYALIGGRNIGDKYFAPKYYKKSVTNDRDVIILNDNKEESVIKDMNNYFEYIFNHKYSKNVFVFTKSIFKKQSNKYIKDIKNKADKARKLYSDSLKKEINLYDKSLPTQNITFIHNPITRFNKEPWVWYQLLNISKNATKSVFIQSPYIIPNKKMTKHYIKESDYNNINISFLTNSMYSTPNAPAFGGYLNYRNKLINKGFDIYELETKDSIHSKSFIIDDNLIAIGSFNLDPRSAFLSTESMVIINSKEVVEVIGNNLLDYTNNSVLINKENTKNKKKTSLIKRIYVRSMQVIVRLFDYLL